MKLYSFWRSSAAFRVRIALNLKSVRYEYVPVNLVTGENDRADYRALNPQGRVPMLVDGDLRLPQSMAILDYLEAKFPRPPLVPEDARERAEMLAFCHAIVADIHPLQNTGAGKYLAERFGADDEGKAAWNRHWIQRGLEILERERAERPDTPFTFGAAPTWADCVLVPQVYNAERWQCDVAGFPRLYALVQRLRQLPAFAAAAPDRQPDTPKN